MRVNYKFVERIASSLHAQGLSALWSVDLVFVLCSYFLVRNSLWGGGYSDPGVVPFMYSVPDLGSVEVMVVCLVVIL